MQEGRYKILIALLSVVSNLVLVTIKVIVGFAMGSISVVSEALHSGVDVFAAVVATIGVKQSAEPADKTHSFGHEKFENLAGFIQAILIFIAGFWIIYTAVRKLIKPAPMESLGLGVAVMLVSSVVNVIVGILLLRAARKTGSVALKADAWHCLTDVYTSAGVMVGLIIVWCGTLWAPGIDLSWVDPLAALLVAVLILKAAWDLTRESVHDLLDVSLPQNEEDTIKSLILTNYPDIVEIHKFRGRKSGKKRFVEFHIKVNPEMSVERSHSLDHGIAAEIKQMFTDADVMVHIEPSKPGP